MKRFISACLALVLLCSQVFVGAAYAYDGKNVSSGVEVVQGDVTGSDNGVVADGVGTQVTVNGNVTGQSRDGIRATNGATVVVVSDDASVVLKVEGGKCGVNAGDYDYAHDLNDQSTDQSTVTVNGDVIGNSSYGVNAINANVTVNGDVAGYGMFSDGVFASNSTVSVSGTVDGDGYGVNASGSIITVGGDVIGYSRGISVNDSKVTVAGNVTANGYAVNIADQSTVKIAGDVTSTDENVAVFMSQSETVDIGGDVKGSVRLWLDAANMNSGALVVGGTIGSKDGNEAPICLAGFDLAALADSSGMPTVEVYELVPANGEYVKVDSIGEELDPDQKKTLVETFLDAIKYIIKADKDANGDAIDISNYQTDSAHPDRILASEGDELIISAKPGYAFSDITADNATVTNNNDGTWTVKVKRGGGLMLGAILKALTPEQPTVVTTEDASDNVNTYRDYPIGMTVKLGTVGGTAHRWKIVAQDEETYTLALLQGLEKMPGDISEFCTEEEMTAVIPGSLGKLDGALYTRYFNDGMIHPVVKVDKNLFELKY